LCSRQRSGPSRLPLRADLPGSTGNLAHLGNDKDFSSTRISYKLNLTGPSINVQTACSTSLVAVHLACQAILSGECEMALAGAASVRVPQRVGYASVKGGILSPDGHCRAFDADAQGTIFGSGVGAVLLKDLAAAIADGNHIYAVIKGSAINNDGADKVSYTASSVAGQARAMVEALAIADVSPDDIGYVECHGTGTVVGDPLEIDALTRAFRTGTQRTGFCAVGSVKSNIGHLEQTAGLAGLIKTALALKHAKIPPSLNFQSPNPKIDLPRARSLSIRSVATGPRAIAPGAPRSIRSASAAPTLLSCSKRRRQPPRRRLNRSRPCSRSQQGAMPHCMRRSSVTSPGSPAIRRRCPTSVSPAPAAERIFQFALPRLPAPRRNCEKRSLPSWPARPRRGRLERAGWPSCSPGKRRSIRAWARNFIAINRYSVRKSTAAPRSSGSGWDARSATCSWARTRSRA